MSTVRHTILHKQPHVIANAAALGTGLAAISAGTLLPVVVHLSTLLVYGPLLLHRRHATRHAFAFGLSLALAKTIDWAIPAWHALSNPANSIATLFLASTVTSGITVGVLLLHTWVRSRIASGWSQAVLFPALWACAWYFVSLISPIGRLSSWAPVSDAMGYEWLMPFTGPTMYDWVAAAWTVVISEVAGAWLMGPIQAEEDEETPLLPDSVKNARSQSHRGIGAVPQLALMLLAMTAPSFFLRDARLPVESPDATGLRVACILPPRPAHRDFDIQDYLRESSHYWNIADVLLWPEGAVTFGSEAARDAAFSNIIELLKNNSKAIIGVSYSDTSSDPSDPTGKTLLHHNGLALLSRLSPEPHLKYYKRNLVPIAESYGMVHSSDPPEVFTYELQVSKKEQRPIPITTSICLDFAMPNTFAQLPSKPALILAPAKTWDRSVARVMWEEAKQRALELDSTVLWCDGGASGLSGVGGKGQDSEPMQIGEGSWTRAIGVEFPFNERRTAYAAGGNAIPISLFFGLVAVGMAFNGVRLDWEKVRLLWDKSNLHKCLGKHLTGPTSPALPSVPSFARSLRGSLHRSSRARSSSSPYRIQQTTAVDRADDEDFCVVNRSELPISLDSPPPTLSRVSTTTTNTGVLGRLRNYSRVSLIARRASSVQKAPPKPTVDDTDHILDSFPAPPTHIPTPIAAAYTTAASPVSTHTLSSLLSTRQDAPSPTSPKRPKFSVDRLKTFAKRALSKKEKRKQLDPSLPPLYELSAVIQKPLPAVPPLTSEPQVPVLTYNFVDPAQLTASPYFCDADLLAPSTRTSFIPPSPSWLSRNVRIDTASSGISALEVPSAPTQSAPASPLPLPIPPRIFISESSSDSPPLSPLDVGDWLTHLESYKNSKLASPSVSRRSSSNSLSSRSSRTLSVQEEAEADLSPFTDTSKTLLFKPTGSSVSVSFNATTAIPIPYTSSAFCLSRISLQAHVHSTLTPQSSVHHIPSADRERFIPAKEPPHINTFPPELVTAAIEAIFANAGLHFTAMDLFGKQGDVVDFAGGTDYSNYKFFAEPPPRREPPPPPEPISSPYVPNEDVIIQNEGFEFALSAAPNVLYARYKQYGQLGVLAWCSEFGELIDALKTLGFQGNMFVSTRTQALKTCAEILRLRLPDVQMQIIIMYLSSQVARLRRFLDSDTQWDDYPELTFPLEPTNVKSPGGH